ncbi:hypothetical protein J2T21_003302 [Paeniglutamicibacter psychrophenolicus]|nr:hypothetical protein [Paeniglutamicibacter psychrophenolicus]
MMSNNHTPPASTAPVPGPRPASPPETARETTGLDVLETLAEVPVAEHLAIFETLQASLAADLESTSQEHP